MSILNISINKVIFIFFISIWIIFLVSILNLSSFKTLLPFAFIPYIFLLINIWVRIYSYRKINILNDKIREYNHKYKRWLFGISTSPLIITLILSIINIINKRYQIFKVPSNNVYTITEIIVINLSLILIFTWMFTFVYYLFLVVINKSLSKSKKVIIFAITAYFSLIMFPVLWYLFTFTEENTYLT